MSAIWLLTKSNKTLLPSYSSGLPVAAANQSQCMIFSHLYWYISATASLNAVSLKLETVEKLNGDNNGGSWRVPN